MIDKQPSGKSPRDLFLEIDALGDEVSSATSLVREAEETSPMQRVLKDQDDRDRAKRKNQYAQLLSCRLLDVEIQPFESPSDKASLMIRSALVCFQNTIEIAECFALVEFLLEHDFVILSTGKVRREKNPRENEDRVFTWFILRKANA
jgi:hypothetical protein